MIPLAPTADAAAADLGDPAAMRRFAAEIAAAGRLATDAVGAPATVVRGLGGVGPFADRTRALVAARDLRVEAAVERLASLVARLEHAADVAAAVRAAEAAATAAAGGGGGATGRRRP